MPKATVNGVQLFYEETGQGTPLVFVHEFAGDHRSWRPQVQFFSRRYRTIAFNARGYPPSDVPDDPRAYSQDQATDDIRGLLDALQIRRAHVCGLSMGGYATLHFGLRYPDRALSLVVGGAGYGSVLAERERFRQDCDLTAARIEAEGMDRVADFYAKGPTRVQFMDKDPVGWKEFADVLRDGSTRGHVLTMRGVQMMRPSIFELGDRLEKLEVPTLVVTGDEDVPVKDETGDLLAAGIAGARRERLAGADHIVPLRKPRELAGLIRELLRATA
jgi:pimeloyl-ACP methyl ester carboxylesterase